MSTPKVDSNTFTVGNPTPESTLTLCQSRLYPPVMDFGFGLWINSVFCTTGLIAMVQIHNSGFCTWCITKRCLHNSRNVSYNDLISQLSMMKDESKYCHNNIKILFFLYVGTSGIRAKFVLWFSHCRIHHHNISSNHNWARILSHQTCRVETYCIITENQWLIYLFETYW